MPKYQLIPCSLCLVNLPKGTLNSHGVCIKCEDGVKDFISTSSSAGEHAEEHLQSTWDALEERTKNATARREEEARKREQEAQIKQELARREAVEAELASRALARRSLLHYVERRIPGYKAGWVHEDIARRIENFVASVERGESPRLILQVCPRAGKALSDKTPVFTFNRGWTTHGELCTDDLVADINGQPTRVLRIGPPVLCDIEITFATGETIVCHDEHEWAVYNRCKRHWEVLETQDILASTCFYNLPDPPVRLFWKLHKELPPDPVSVRSIRHTQNSELGRCIEVESPYGIYLAGTTLLPTHNSELASISGPAWILGHHPDWTILLTSYSDELPISWSRSIREQLKSEEFQTLFPNGGVVSKIDAGAKAWSTEQGGGVRASGVGGSILGFGAQIVIVDDPIKGAEEADSPGLLEKNWDWATSALYSRLMPGGGLIIIQQRWSNEDLVGRFISQMEAEQQEIEDLRASAKELRKKPDADALDLEEADNYEREAQELEDSMDRWDVVKYPALAEQDEYLSPEGDIVRFTKYEEVPANYRLLRRTGEALHPERFGRNYFLKIKRSNPRRFAALYQQTPIVDEGQYFVNSDFKRYNWKDLPPVQFMNRFAAFDLAIGTKQSNDYTVGLVGGFDHEGRLWFLDRIRGRFGDLEKVADMIMELHEKHSCIITGIERTHLEMALHPILKRKMRERNKFILLAEGKDALKPISDKFVRARQLQALAKAGMVYVPEADEWNDFVQEMVRFGSSKTDDQVDAAAWLVILASKYALPDNPDGSAKVDKSWYEEFLDDYLTKKVAAEKPFMAA